METDTRPSLRIALFEPDIPQNTGAILRLAACFRIGVDIIEPCGFVFSERKLRRAGMDYLDKVEIGFHRSWNDFLKTRVLGDARILLFTTKSSQTYTSYSFKQGDTLLFGRESAGVPEYVRQSVTSSITIPMAKGMRSLNVAQAASMVLGEALRQMDVFPNAS